jgi:hypothetical protein
MGTGYHWRIKGLDLLIGLTYPWMNGAMRDIWRFTEITTLIHNLWEYLEPSEGGVATTCLSLGGRVALLYFAGTQLWDGLKTLL